MAAWRLSKYDLGHISPNKTDFGSLSGGDHLELARDFADPSVRIAPDDACYQTDLEFVKFWRNEAIESAWNFVCSLDALPFHSRARGGCRHGVRLHRAGVALIRPSAHDSGNWRYAQAQKEVSLFWGIS